MRNLVYLLVALAVIGLGTLVLALRAREPKGFDSGIRAHQRHMDALSTEAVTALLERAAQRLGRPARIEQRSGRVEREVVAAADGAAVLICARDGDRSRLGPRSLGPATRFVVDHVPCPVLLVWPGEAPGVDSIPPPPPPGAKPPPPPPHERR